MTNDIQKRLHNDRLAQLANKRSAILSLPPEKALDAILDTPQSLPLVHSFPEEDFYLLIHEIGVDDSLPLLSLASNRQWEYLLDLEIFHKDRIDGKKMIEWLNLLLEADYPRMVRWLDTEKRDLLQFLLKRTIHVLIREHDQDPTEFGPDFHTFDDVFYFNILNAPDSIEATADIENRDDTEETNYSEMIYAVLSKLAEVDHIDYQNLLLESASTIPSEAEEEMYRLRNVRLAEKGFLPFDEAIGIYQPPLNDKMIFAKVNKVPQTDSEDYRLPIPLYPLSILNTDAHFVKALQHLPVSNLRHHILLEFAALCNRLVIADQKLIRSKTDLTLIAEKSCGYITIGLEVSAGNRPLTPHTTAAMLADYPLTDLFRIGFNEALKLKWRAEKWRANSWFAETGLSLKFWSEYETGVLGGLLLKRPLFFDNYKTGLIYREFMSLSDIEQTANTLHSVMTIDHVFSRMNIAVQTNTDLFLTYKNLLLTLWAKDLLALDGERLILTLDEFRRFFCLIFALPHDSDTHNSIAHHPRNISPDTKAGFLTWLAQKTGMAVPEITGTIGHCLENLFSEIESDYGAVAVKDLDARYIQLFLVKG